MCGNMTVISYINNMGLYKIRLLQQIPFNQNMYQKEIIDFINSYPRPF